MRSWDLTRRITKGQPVEQAKKDLARQFRKSPTPSERTAWELLRGRRLLGLKFRRQQVILGFIVDFFCAEHRLVLEVDGSSHEPLERQVADEERTQVLASLELRVVRISNEDLSEAKLRSLLAEAIGIVGHPLSLQGEGDGG
jgi:very-short-patch-repair endonuclease